MSAVTSPTSAAPKQGLAHRVMSGSSTIGSPLSDDEYEEVDPNDTAALLEERLRAWKHACASLEQYVESLQKMQKSHAKEYEKVLKTIPNPLNEAHQFDPGLQGITGFFDSIRTNTQGIANIHGETAKSLDQVLSVLKGLHSEIKGKNKQMTKSVEKSSKAVAKLRAASQKHIEALGQYAAAYDSASGKVDNAQNDPYVLHRAIRHKLYKQVQEENNNRNEVIGVQETFAHFEDLVVSKFSNAMDLLQQIMGKQADLQKSMYTDITHKMHQIPPKFEWTQFIHRNSNVIVDPAIPPRKPEEMAFANEGHRSTEPLIAGKLERKSRALGGLTGYKSAYYAVSPSKFLHQYDDDNDRGKNEPSPDLSLYLPDCTVGAVAGSKFNVKGKDVSKGKVGNAFQTNHELQFKAHNDSEAAKWWKIIAQCAGQTALTDELPSPGSTTASPATTTAPSSVLTSPVEKTAASPVAASPATTAPVAATTTTQTPAAAAASAAATTSPTEKVHNFSKP